VAWSHRVRPGYACWPPEVRVRAGGKSRRPKKLWCDTRCRDGQTLRNYLGTLMAKIGVTPARDFAVGVLTERVRQEEGGWPDQPGDAGGKRSAHGTGASHLCLLERKHQVEKAIYAAPAAAAASLALRDAAAQLKHRL